MKTIASHKIKMNVNKFILSIVLILIPFLQSQSQESKTIFYYSFNEKVELTPLTNKAIVRFHSDTDSAEAFSFIESTVNSPVAFTTETIDSKTFFIKSANTDLFVESLKHSTKVLTINPIYITGPSDLELGVTDDIVMKPLQGVSQNALNELNSKYGLTVKKTSDSYVLLGVPEKEDALTIANAYFESGLVKYSHPDFIAKVEKFYMPNDTYFNYQFGLHNTGQVINDMHTGNVDADVDAPCAWDISKGSSSIVIAVIDEGVTNNHPDLPSSRQVRLNGSNFADVSTPNDPSPTGNGDHGNACAGIIAATMDNNEGVTGIAPNCKIMPVKIPFGSFPSSIYASAIDFAKLNGADILSNSWGYGGLNSPNLLPDIVTAINSAATTGRSGKGAVVVFAAGNTANHAGSYNGYITFPGNVTSPSVITVGASDRYDMQSNYSPTSNPLHAYNQIIDISAPSHRAYPSQIAGEDFEVWSLDIPGNAGYNPSSSTGEILPNTGTNYLSYTGRMGGTSAATPLVAGIAALVLSVNPSLTSQDVFTNLMSTADKVGGYSYVYGFSNELGNGRANACNALTNLTSPCATNYLNISTGYNHKFSSLYSNESYDAYWDLVTSPINGLQLPRPAGVIQPDPAWSTSLTNSKWLAPVIYKHYNYPSGYGNNPPPLNPYIFQTAFCVSQNNSQISINLDALSDDIAEIWIDNTQIPSSPIGFSTPVHVSYNVTLSGGTHYLKAKVRNYGGDPLGIKIQGYITGNNLLKQKCCDSTSCITGMKFWDKNRNGLRETNEPGLRNWPIFLNGSSTPIYTDSYGLYTICGLYPQYHTIRERRGFFWRNTTPLAYNTFLQSSEVQNFDFGNRPRFRFFGRTEVGNPISLKASLMSATPPYQVVDTGIAYQDSVGIYYPTFTNDIPTGNYYISIGGSNVLETWSAAPIYCDSNSSDFTYDFTSSQSQAYGSNLTFVNGKWSFYVGDVNQDGYVDLPDAMMVDNDMSNFVTGEVVTDVNGDGIVDVGDAAIVDVNSFNFVSVVKP